MKRTVKTAYRIVATHLIAAEELLTKLGIELRDGQTIMFRPGPAPGDIMVTIIEPKRRPS